MTALFLKEPFAAAFGKNNAICRLAGVLVGRRVARLEVRFLESGHSHEDIDQYFSGLSNLIEREREAHTPQQFLDLLRRFIQEPNHRPLEPQRVVYKVDQVRNWSLALRKWFILSLMGFSSIGIKMF